MASPRTVSAPADYVTAIGTILLGLVTLHLGLEHIPTMLDTADPLLLVLQAIELVVLLGFPLLLLVAGRWVSANAVEQGYDPDHQWTMATWTTVGVVTIPVVIGAIKLHQFVTGLPLQATVVRMELLAGAGIGGALGLLVGVNVARARLQTARLREQRDAFAFLNRALRHHALNGTNVIEGYAEKVRERLPPADRELVTPIQHRSRTITELVHSVAAIVETFTGPNESHPIELVEVIAEEIAEARLAYPDATFDIDLGGVVYVRGNERLQLAIMSLLANAVEHNDRDHPRVTVRLRREPEDVIVEVADDGPGLDTAEREAAFQPGTTGDAGLGLYLVERIVSDHDGSVAIRDNEPRGTVVSVLLPRTSPPDRGTDPTVGHLGPDRRETLRRFGRTRDADATDQT